MAKRTTQSAAPPGVVKAVGQLTVNFTTLEVIVALAVWTLLGVDEATGRIVTSDMSYRVLVDKMCALYRQRLAESAPAEPIIKDLCRRLQNAGADRNRIVHAAWGEASEPAAALAIRATARGFADLKVTEIRMTPRDVAEVADRIAALTREVLEQLVPGLKELGDATA